MHVWNHVAITVPVWAPHPLGSHPSGLHPSGPHPSGLHPSGPHPSGLHHDTHQIGQTGWPKMDWPKLDWPKLAKSGWPRTDWPKSVSAVAFRVHWLLTARTPTKSERVVCQWDGALRYKWDGAEKEHGRKIKREGEAVSPCIACRGPRLGLPFERVVSLADGWMGVGTWGWCNGQMQYPTARKT